MHVITRALCCAGLVILVFAAARAQAQELTPEMRELHEFRYAEAVDCVGLSQMFDGLEGMAPGFVSQGLAIDPEGRTAQDTLYRQVSYLMGRGLGRADDEIAQAWTDAGNGYIDRLNAANATTGLTTTSAFFTDEIMPVWTACEDSRLGAEAWLAAMAAVLGAE